MADGGGFPVHAGRAEAGGERIGGEGEIECRSERPVAIAIHQKRMVSAMVVIVGGDDVEHRPAENFLHAAMVARQGSRDFHQLGVFEPVA